MQSIKNDCHEMAQRPYIGLVSKDFSEKFMIPLWSPFQGLLLCLWSHGLVFKAQPFLPRWLKCREAVVAASQCGTVNVVEFHLGPAASGNTLVHCAFVSGVYFSFFSWKLTCSTVWWLQ